MMYTRIQVGATKNETNEHRSDSVSSQVDFILYPSVQFCRDFKASRGHTYFEVTLEHIPGPWLFIRKKETGIKLTQRGSIKKNFRLVKGLSCPSDRRQRECTAFFLNDKETVAIDLGSFFQ